MTESSVANARFAPALGDIRVLDLTIARAGPVAVRQFADWGASVIRVDSPSGSDLTPPTHSDYLNLHRNKRAIVLNLKTKAGREVLHRLVEQSDVLVENFRPQVKANLGVGYPTISAINPRIVYGSVSGFGQDGPYAEKGGVDQIVQGLGGLMQVTGAPGKGPMRVGTAIADLAAGHHLAFGLLVALHEREQSGIGQWVYVSLLESMIATMDFQAVSWTIDGVVPAQVGNDHPNSVPMSAYPTKDGVINIAASSDRLFERFANLVGQPELLDDSRYKDRDSRLRNREALNAHIEAITVTKTSSEWCKLLDEVGIPAGPIYSIDEAFEDPQVKHLQMTTRVRHKVRGNADIIRQPVNMSRTPAKVTTPSPMPGEHQNEILSELSYSPTDIERLRSGGAF